MVQKKKVLLLLMGLFLVSFSSLVLAQGDLFGGALDTVLEIGSLEFIFGSNADNKFIGFVRIAIAVLIFTIIYMGLSFIPNMSRNISIVIASVLAIVSSVFMPASVLSGFGGTYAVIFAFLIIGGPISGVGWLLFGTPTPGRFVAALKFLGVLLLMWLVDEVAHWAIELANAVRMI